MRRVYAMFLFLLVSNTGWSDTFDLVCDTPLQRNTYRFDSESKIVTKIGYYSYDVEGFTNSPVETLYNTVEWDTEADALVWVTYDFTNPVEDDVLFTNIRHGTILTIVFDLHYNYMTYTVLTRVRGLLKHYASARRKCYLGK
jgi:hypothetical protein